MRTSSTLHHFSPVSKTATSIAATETFSPPPTTQTTPWHSPLPYLFGGLAAVLGLIAFSFILLACSYWKLSGGEDGRQGGVAGKGGGSSDVEASAAFEDKFLVIMAGQEKPTYLATPTLGRAKVTGHEMVQNQNRNELRIVGNDEESQIQT